MSMKLVEELEIVPTLVTDLKVGFKVDFKVDFKVNHCNEMRINDDEC